MVAALALLLIALALLQPAGVAAGPFLQPANPAQGFDPDYLACIGATAPDPLSPLTGCGGTESLLLGAASDVEMAVRLPMGSRLGQSSFYAGPGWRWPGNGLQSLDTGTQAGTIVSSVDLGCNGTVDTTGSSTSFVRTTNWGSGSGPSDQPDETYLGVILPPAAVMTREYRTRAEVGAVGSQTVTPALVINQVGLSPVWSPNTLVTAMVWGSAGAAPSTQMLCFDSPRSSTITTPSMLAANPSRAYLDANGNSVDDNSGYYARWAVFVSAPDVVNGELQGVVVLNCKYVSADYPGGTATVAAPGGSDDDGDCLQDTTGAEPGRPVDGDDGNADRDGDGLIDGVEVAWGSCPDNTFVFSAATRGFAYDCQYLDGVGGATRTMAQARDTDQDGRSDLEEMLDGTDLSDPTTADTDGDGVNDGGIAWDASGDGIPDSTLAANSSQTLLGTNCSGGTVACTVAKVNKAFQIPGTVLHPFEGDNCTNIWNSTQANTESVALAFTSTLLTGTDKTNPHEDRFGDACDLDDDNDAFSDTAEAQNRWLTGFPAKACNVVSEGGNVVAATNAPPTLLKDSRDSDKDGTLDGRECEGGTNPAVGCGASYPCTGFAPTYGTGTYNNLPLDSANGCSGTVIEPCGPDGDALGATGERYYRTTGINQQDGSGLACGAGQLCDIDKTYLSTDGTLVGTVNDGPDDKDGDADGILDSYEVFIWGTNPANQDTDGDGCPDGVEIVSVAAPDNKVEFNDQTALLNVWNKSRGSAGPAFEPLLDYNGSGKIEFGDFTIMTDLWNKLCGTGAILEN